MFEGDLVFCAAEKELRRATKAVDVEGEEKDPKLLWARVNVALLDLLAGPRSEEGAGESYLVVRLAKREAVLLLPGVAEAEAAAAGALPEGRPTCPAFESSRELFQQHYDLGAGCETLRRAAHASAMLVKLFRGSGAWEAAED